MGSSSHSGDHEKAVPSTVSPKLGSGGAPLAATTSYQHPHSQGQGAAEAQVLSSLGYEPELRRNLSLWTVLGLGAAIIAAPFGLSTSASFALTNGGTTSYIWGWVLLSLISLALAASLGEICSQYPSSGGVYLWTAHLAPRRVSKISSFIVGWISVVANLTLCLSIAFGEAQLIMAAISVFRDDAWAPEAWQIILTFWAIMVLCAAINAWGVRGNLLEPINTISIYWTLASAVIICIVVLVMSDDRRSARDVFAQWQNASGWADGWSFFVGLLTPAYVLTGYGTISYLCEEVKEPEVAVPRAMMGSVIAASFTGFLFVIPMSFVFPSDLSEILDAAAGQPIPVALSRATGSAGGGFGLLFLILGVGMFASVGSLTVALRSVWAFSRDGGLPFSSIWKKVDRVHQLPLNSLIGTTVIISLLGLIYLGASAAFNAFTGSCTILLGLSYVYPVACSLAGGRRLVKDAPWSLGRFGYLINIIALIWVIFSCILFCFPTTAEVDASAMNYASVVVVFFGFFAALYYLIWARGTYQGPSLEIDEHQTQKHEIDATAIGA